MKTTVDKNNKTKVKITETMTSYSNDGNEDSYVQELENQFEYWNKVSRENKKLTEENRKLKTIIERLSKKFSKNKEGININKVRLPLKIIRQFFIPTFRPDIVREKLNLYSSNRLLVKKTEEYGLFKYPELVIRVPRTRMNKGKHETTVLYSLMGMIVLKETIHQKRKEIHKQAPKATFEEQAEIESMFTPEELEELKRNRNRPITDYKIVKVS